MVVRIMLEIGKVYKWSDIVEAYPDLWVFITDVVETQDGNIDTCKLLKVCKHDETAKYIKQFKEEGITFWCERTTFSAPNVGFLC